MHQPTQTLTLANARELHASIQRDLQTLGLILELATRPPAPAPAPEPPPVAPSKHHPTTPALIDEDRDCLRSWFLNQGDFIGQDVLHVVAVHHTADQLIALGLIEPGKQDRWLYGYRSAGELRAELDLITT